MEKLRQLLKEAGLSDEQIEKIIKESITDKFVPKHRLDETLQKNKQLEDTIKDRDTQITNLKKFEGDNETLKTKIEELEQANKDKDAKNAEAIRTLKIENHINYALSGKVQEGYDDLVRGLIDKSLIVLKEDGTISGLDEQIEKAKKDKPLLFVNENSDNKGTDDKGKGWSFKGDDPANNQKQTDKTVAENFVNSLVEDNKAISDSASKASEFYFGKQ